MLEETWLEGRCKNSEVSNRKILDESGFKAYFEAPGGKEDDREASCCSINASKLAGDGIEGSRGAPGGVFFEILAFLDGVGLEALVSRDSVRCENLGVLDWLDGEFLIALCGGKRAVSMLGRNSRAGKDLAALSSGGLFFAWDAMISRTKRTSSKDFPLPVYGIKMLSQLKLRACPVPGLWLVPLFLLLFWLSEVFSAIDVSSLFP